MASLRASKRWKSWVAKVWAVWWVGKNSLSDSFYCLLYFQTCRWSCFVMLKEDFSKTFERSNSPEMLLQGFECLNVQIWVNSSTMWHNVYQNHLFCFPKTMVVTFPVEGVAITFFWGEVTGYYSNECLVCNSKWCIIGRKLLVSLIAGEQMSAPLLVQLW